MYVLTVGLAGEEPLGILGTFASGSPAPVPQDGSTRVLRSDISRDQQDPARNAGADAEEPPARSG